MQTDKGMDGYPALFITDLKFRISVYNFEDVDITTEDGPDGQYYKN